MRTHRVFLNYTEFKTDTLVACGFLVGAHPGHIRREEAEEEIRGSLGLDPEELDFQLSARLISVPIQEGESACFTFQALVIEMSTKNATILRERFYKFQPSKIVKNYPYTGLYPFVPMIKSKEWSIQKIHQLAQLHFSILNDLKAIYVSNILDKHHLINDAGESLLQHFLDQKTSIQHNNDANLPEPLFHSIHNTVRPHVEVFLMKTSNYDEAMGHLTNLHNILCTSIPIKYHHNVLIPGDPPQISGQQSDSISSCNHLQYVEKFLSGFNPQTRPPSNSKRF
jgi:hypothetical protein